MEIDLTTPKSQEIIAKYGTEQNHVYTTQSSVVFLDGKITHRYRTISVDTKWQCLSLEDEDGDTMKIAYHPEITSFEQIGNTVLISSDKSENVFCLVISSNEEEPEIICTLMQFIKTGDKSNFASMMKDSVQYKAPIKNIADAIFWSFFVPPTVHPFKTEAKYTKFSSDDGMETYDNVNVFFGPNADISYDNWIADENKGKAGLKIDVVIEGSNLSTTRLLEAMVDTTYLGKDGLSVYIGENDDYMQFEFADETLAQRVYDFIMLPARRITKQEMITASRLFGDTIL